MSRNVFKGEVPTNLRKPKKLTRETIYIKEYGKIKQGHARNMKMANNASDNGRCWWIYSYILGNITYENRKG